MMEANALLPGSPVIHSAVCLLGGAYDGLSALLVERAGFDAVWASGFSISASKCLPDCNIMTIPELLTRVAEMTRAVKIPVIVDCDEGYGDLSNTESLAVELAECGVRGVCIEDSKHPKINSFFGNHAQALSDVESYVRKLKVLRQAAPGLMLIARTESLIAGESIDFAVARGLRYAESGADFVMIHSRSKTLGEFKAISGAWSGSVPLAVVPTLAESLSWNDLARSGFQMIIYANQALRAAVHAQEQALREIRDITGIRTGDRTLASMEHIFTITDLRSRQELAATSELNGKPTDR